MKPSDFLTELSNDKLTQYKTAAAADASKADKEGDFKKGDKRFSGIVKATKKQFDNDAKKDVAEASDRMQRYGQLILKRKAEQNAAAQAAGPQPKKEEPPASSDYDSMSTRDFMKQLRDQRRPKKKGVAEGLSEPTRKVFFKVIKTQGTGMPSGYRRVKTMRPLEDGGFYIELSTPGYGMDYTRHNYKNFSLKDDQGKPITGHEANNIINGEQGVAENVAGDVNSKKRYHFLYPHVPLDMHTDHEYNDLSDRDLQAVKSHQRELAYKLGKPGAEEQSDIASHIQINRARSQYDQEQAHRRKVLDAEKIKRQARDAKRQQGVAEGLDEAVGGNYLYHGRSSYDAKDILSSGMIPKSKTPQKATDAQTQMPNLSVTRDWGYASGANASDQLAGIGRDIVFVLDRNAVESNFKTLGTSQSTQIKGLSFNPYLKKDGEARSQNTDAMARANAKAKAKYAEPTAKSGGEFEEVVVIPKGALPLKGTMVGFWVNPKSELMKDPAIMNDPRRLDMVRPNQFVKAKQEQGVAEADIIGFRRSADAISKQKVWQSSAASDSKQDDKTFSYQGYTINFTPDKLNIYLGGDLVLSRKGNFANPTKMQLVAARGNIGKIIDDKRRAALIRSVIQKNKGIQGVAEEKCPHCNGPMVSEELINEKKDACYYKVKSRYKVWPSAYASGALVKCRKKGADSWGNGSKNESSILEGIEQADESLHDWFNKEKWVRMDTKGNIKGPCAKEPGEGKPKCLPQAKAHSLGKKGRASAAARKRREDPNPDRSGKAINVNTKKTKG